MFPNSLVGKVVEGQYKRAGRASTTIALEVTAHLKIADSRGSQVPYLFGTRLDAQAAGSVVLVRANCFRKDGLVIREAAGFAPIDLTGWYVTHPSEDNASFAFVEKVEENDRAWAEALGGRKLVDFVVEP